MTDSRATIAYVADADQAAELAAAAASSAASPASAT